MAVQSSAVRSYPFTSLAPLASICMLVTEPFIFASDAPLAVILRSDTFNVPSRLLAPERFTCKAVAVRVPLIFKTLAPAASRVFKFLKDT